MWFLEDPARLQRERNAIADLQQSAAWLDGVHWKLDPSEGLLLIDCNIVLDEDAIFPICLTFPKYFPTVVPSIRPREKERWSGHQYGEGGDLCLELGPDSWHPDHHSAANVLQSGHDLLSLEAQHKQDDSIDIPSRHALTDGQQVRTSARRFVLTPEAEANLDALPEGAAVRCRIDAMFHENVMTAFLSQLEIENGETWEDPTLPGSLKRYGIWYDGVAVSESVGILQHVALLSEGGVAKYLADQSIPSPGDEDTDPAVDAVRCLLVRPFDGARWQLYWCYQGGGKASVFTTVEADTDDGSLRLGEDRQALSEKAVAIVGLGSAGSKIATSLARSGVGRFVLIDDDLLHPTNLVRHDSDWLHVGQHKVDAVADRLRLINPAVEIICRKHRIGGQEAPTAAASALSALGIADIIIDASASPPVFNQCAHIARQSKTPLLWLEVYAGGIGGLVARARPGKDAEPFTLRTAIYDSAGKVADEMGVEPPESMAQYTAEGVEEQVLIATDADVTVIAASLAKIADDTLRGVEPSDYTYPAYLIGLSRSWVFQQPFHVLPVECTADTSWSLESEPDAATYREGADFIGGLVEQVKENAGS